MMRKSEAYNLTDEQVQDIVSKFGKIGFITHDADDSTIQALANFFGIQISYEHLNKAMVTTYIIAHQKWFKDQKNKLIY